MSFERFTYDGFSIDEHAGVLTCHYRLDHIAFEERVFADPGAAWTSPAVREAARIVALLAGVSYYKAGSPPVIDLAEFPVRDGDAEFLKAFYVEGLAEYAHHNRVDLRGITIVGGVPAPPPTSHQPDTDRPLIPFGGGLDSVVTVELLKPVFPDAALFILSRRGDHFEPLERAAATTGLPIVRAERELDPQILRSDELGFRNGHVPVTGIVSAIAVLAAALDGRSAVVMSNERSASDATLGSVNHQWSKSAAFEDGFRAVLERGLGGAVDYFSELRPFSELWIAERFARSGEYFDVFHSCNRAFHIDPVRRRVEWCGECDKCCFIDLILSPFLGPDVLSEVFDGHEPLDNPSLAPRFHALLGTAPKPFECVGDVDECRAAIVQCAARPDRAGYPMVQALAAGVGTAATPPACAGPHHVPDAFFPAAALG